MIPTVPCVESTTLVLGRGRSGQGQAGPARLAGVWLPTLMIFTPTVFQKPLLPLPRSNC